MSSVHLHLILNHVPVVGTVIGLLLLAYAALRRDDGLVRVCLGLFAVLGLAGAATFLSGEPAEEAVEGIAGVTEALVERHEEAALMATVALGGLGAASLAALLWLRGRPLPRRLPLAFLVAAVVPAAGMARAANLGGQIRHTEIRSGGDAPAAVPAPPAETPAARGAPGATAPRSSHR
jgi:hypothetical protein